MDNCRSLRTPRFCYFDLGNVLLKFSHQLACEQMSAVCGIASSRIWEIVFQSSLEDRFERGAISSLDFYEHFCRETQTKAPMQEIVAAASSIFQLNLPVAPIVWQLHAAGMPLGILSNTNEDHWRYCVSGRYTLIDVPFRVRALSFELKSMKPERRIYELAAELCGVEADEIFFVDDRPENVEGAIAAGFDAVLYQSAAQLFQDLRRRGIRLNM